MSAQSVTVYIGKLTIMCGRGWWFKGGVFEGLHRASHALWAGVEGTDRRTGGLRYYIQCISPLHCRTEDAHWSKVCMTLQSQCMSICTYMHICML